MLPVLFILLSLVLLLTEIRILWIFLPELKSRAGKAFLFASAGLLFLLSLLPALFCRSPLYSFSAVLVTAAAFLPVTDRRKKGTAHELYPVVIGLIAPIVMIGDFLSNTPILHHTLASPVIGLAIGLGAAMLLSLTETILFDREPQSLHAAGMCAVCGFFSGWPGVLWVLGVCALLVGLQKLLGRWFPRFAVLPDLSGCAAFSLAAVLCVLPVFCG